MLFTAPTGSASTSAGSSSSTRRSASAPLDGTPFPKVLRTRAIIPGIKVDTGAKPLAAAAEGETVTEGLDGLRERLAEYHALGARFAKWRATYSITDTLPSPYAIDVNADALARYAALCQEAGHRADRRARSADGGRPHHRAVVRRHRRGARGAVRRPLRAARPPRPARCSSRTWCCRATTHRRRRRSRRSPTRRSPASGRTVPAAVPGIVFLSGGSERRVTPPRTSTR